MTESVRSPDWLEQPGLQLLLRALNEGDGEARVAGGAVRNALLGEAVNDVDVAVNLPPATVSERLAASGFKVVPTGIEHGTVTAVHDGTPYEVTTLREDVETDGRHATVVFGTDWRRDAERRDLTMNALYMEADGTVFDPLGVEADVHARVVRFVGDAETRIREDYLRSLRFFRFFAWYGKFRPDADGLRACARTKDGIASLSVERVWSETKRLLAAPDPSRALLWMRQTGVLTAALPETEKWGIDAVPGLVAAEEAFGWAPDAMLRLMATVPPDGDRMNAMADRLRLSKAERVRLFAWSATGAAKPARSEDDLAQAMYEGSQQGVEDVLRLALAKAHVAGDLSAVGGLRRQLDFAVGWKRPTFPVQGRDLVGIEAGPAMGERLRELEERWIASGFRLAKSELLGK